MSLNDLLENWQSEPTISENIVTWRRIPAQEPIWFPWPEDLSPALVLALQQVGILGLFRHQQDAWREIQNGRNLVITTGTASGKTLCYNLPVLDRLIRDRNARALYLFPTKALAQDQQQKIKVLAEALQRQPGFSPDTAETGYLRHLRWRHTCPQSRRHPPKLPSGDQQSRYATHRYFASPHLVGRFL